MLEELVTTYGNRFLVAALGVSLALLCLFVVLRLLRNRAPSPFVRGGRNRQPRLQVLDAAAVDARRRLVLVRRDNVEHLVMIGGPTDIVIESGIGDERAYLSAVPVAASVENPETAARIAPHAVSPRSLPQEQPVPPVEQAPRPPVAERPPAPQPVKAEPVAARPAQQSARAPAPRPEPAAPPVAVAVPEPVAQAHAPQTATAAPTESPESEATSVQPIHIEPPPASAAATAPSSDARAAMPVQQPAPAAPPPKQQEQSEHQAQGQMVHAEDILEAARQRVLPSSQDQPPAASIAPAVHAADEQHPKQELSEFERVLEEEMALHLSANETAATRTPFDVAAIVPDIRPNRPVAPPVIVTPPPGTPTSGNREEPNLQKEIARIFGEISVNRNN